MLLLSLSLQSSVLVFAMLEMVGTFLVQQQSFAIATQLVAKEFQRFFDLRKEQER